MKKRILFLVDKKAALDVVHKKLKDAGLDNFCLKIESAGKKIQVIDDIKKRLDLKKKNENSSNFEAQLNKEKFSKR